MTEFIRAVRERQAYQFQRKYRDVDVLMVDDVQFLARAEETQNEFFHTFNHLHQPSGQIVIASDRPPQELAGIEERLDSRFRWGSSVDVQPPDLETRIAILQLKAMRDRSTCPIDVLQLHRDQVRAEHPRARGRAAPGGRVRLAARASPSTWRSPNARSRTCIPQTRPGDPAPADPGGDGLLLRPRPGPTCLQDPVAPADDRPARRHVPAARADRPVADQDRRAVRPRPHHRRCTASRRSRR